MDSYITLEGAANIVTLIIPGYVAGRAYASVYAKGDKDFSRILVESVALSLPILSLFNLLWTWAPGNAQPEPTRSIYILLLLAFSTTLGLLFARLRKLQFFKQLARPFAIPDPEQDFLRQQFAKLTRNEVVSVTLQNGDVFSGTPQGGSIYKEGVARHYYFNNVAWFNKTTGSCDERPGSIVIDLTNVLHVETERPLPKD